MKSVADIFRSYAVFDTQGRHTNGCDKMSNHNYGDAYEKLIDYTFYSEEDEVGPYPARSAVKLMMEIGVADGSSLLAWSEIFPNALCVGMDIHPAARLDTTINKRIEFTIGDQRSLDDCQRVASKRQFDIIVEDATHNLADSLVTLLYLWPFVKPGGLYIIEEFANIGALRNNVLELWCDKSGCGEAVHSEIIDTQGPFGGIEPLIVFRKPL